MSAPLALPLRGGGANGGHVDRPRDGAAIGRMSVVQRRRLHLALRSTALRLTGFIVMIRYSLHRLTKVRTAILSGQDGTLEAAYRELLALREQVGNAELAAAKHRSATRDAILTSERQETAWEKR